MEDYPHICTDPLGDPHTIMEKYYICGVAEDHSRSYQDKYYPLGWYRRAPMYTSPSENTEAAIRAIAQNWADRRQATFRWMLGRRG